jgi:hypothetical protein
MRYTSLYLLVLFFWNCSKAQPPKCSQELRFNHLAKKLETSICIPNGYFITQIEDAWDLNGDGVKDKIVSFQRKKLNDGDTIFYDIYTRDEKGRLQFFKKLGNLEPLFFTNYGAHTGNKLYDSIKTLYSYPTLSEVNFSNNSISLKFFTEATTIRELMFTYSAKDNTWILNREMQWFAPSQFEDDRKLEFNRVSKEHTKIEDFNLLIYIVEE